MNLRIPKMSLNQKVDRSVAGDKRIQVGKEETTRMEYEGGRREEDGGGRGEERELTLTLFF